MISMAMSAAVHSARTADTFELPANIGFAAQQQLIASQAAVIGTGPSVHLVFNLAGLEHCQQRRQADEPIGCLVMESMAPHGHSNCFVLEQDAIARLHRTQAVQFSSMTHS